MLESIDHIGIAVKDIEQSLLFWKKMFGLKDFGIEKIEERGVQVVRMDCDAGPSLELVAPLKKDSPVDNFLEKRGEGIHHICFRVPDIRAAVQALQKEGVAFVDPEPREGAEGSLVVFISPRSFNGVLIELKEDKQEGTE